MNWLFWAVRTTWFGLKVVVRQGAVKEILHFVQDDSGRVQDDSGGILDDVMEGREVFLFALMCKAPDPADTRAGSSAPPVRATRPKGSSSQRAVQNLPLIWRTVLSD